MEDKEIFFPNGILLNLYKHIDVARFKQEINDQYVILKTKVALGNFDRLRFYPINDFTDFRKQSCTGHLWTGGRRDIMLFSLSNSESDRSFRFSCQKSETNIDQTGKPYGYILPWDIEMLYKGAVTQRAFLSVSMLYLSGKAKNLGMSYDKLISYCKSAITKIVEKVNEKKRGNKIIFEVFGSLNSAEIAILWGSDEYVEIQYIVDQLRYMNIKKEEQLHRVFYSSYTIVSINERTNTDMLTSIRGGCMIQFATSTKTAATSRKDIAELDHTHIGAIEYIKKETKALECESLKAGEVFSCAGEYDHIYNGDAPLLRSLVRKENTPQAFDDCNKDFQKHFSSTTTRLYYREDDVKEISDALKADLNHLLLIAPVPSDYTQLHSSSICQPDFEQKTLDEWESLPTVFDGRNCDPVRKKYVTYKEELKNLLIKSDGSITYSGLSISNYIYNLDLLFCDYVQCVSTMPDLQWAKDFEYQFFSALEVLYETLPTEEELSKADVSFGSQSESLLDSYISDALNIIAVLHYNIHHMSEAGKLFFEEPGSHSESTGQYDLIIHTYYGIIKNVLLEVAKNSRHLNDKPTPLVPILRFSNSPIIESKLYFDGMNLARKIVDVRIPYDACGEIGLYSPLLIHEIYHYVPPVDRAARNRTFAIILLTELTVDSLQKIISSDTFNISPDLAHDILLKFRERLIVALDSSPGFLAAIPSLPDNNWNDFSYWLIHWIKIFDFNQSREYNLSFVYFFYDVLSNVYNDLKRWSATDDINDSMKKLVADLAKVIVPSRKSINNMIVDNTPSGIKKAEKFLLYVVCHRSNDLYENLEMVLRELLPDYAMMHYSNISKLSEYFLLIAIIVDKQFSKSVAVIRQDFLFFRIFFIADCLLSQLNMSIDNLEAEINNSESLFCNMYCAYRKLGLDQEFFGRDYTYQKDAHEWFEYFKGTLLTKKEIYSLYQPLLRQLSEEQFAAGMVEKSEEVWKVLLEPFNALIQPETALFYAELKVIYAFQPQVFLSEIEGLIQEPDTLHTSSSSATIPPFTPHRSLEYRVEYAAESEVAIKAAADMLQEYHRRVFGEQSHAKLWFRGCKSSTFPILPSIMVHFLDRDKTCPNGKNYIGTLVQYQRALLEEFKYRADGASEFINASSYTIADYIALMQHYSQQTCYVDWSDDVYSSLYFALADEIKEAQRVTKKKTSRVSTPSENAEKVKQNDYDPVLYLFDPKLYNLARLRIIKKYSTEINQLFLRDPQKPYQTAEDLKDPKKATLYAVINQDLFDAEKIEKEFCNKQLSDVSVPNISMRDTAKRYGIHSYDLVYNEGFIDERLRDSSIKDKESLKSAAFKDQDGKDTFLVSELWNLPMAIYTSRLNPRIRTQSGNFLAYSIFTRPVCYEESEKRAQWEEEDVPPKTEYFNYLSLKEIQKFYLNTFTDAVPFMAEVIIPRGEKKSLAEYLCHVGINKYRIYPELDNLSLS